MAKELSYQEMGLFVVALVWVNSSGEIISDLGTLAAIDEFQALGISVRHSIDENPDIKDGDFSLLRHHVQEITQDIMKKHYRQPGPVVKQPVIN